MTHSLRDTFSFELVGPQALLVTPVSERTIGNDGIQAQLLTFLPQAVPGVSSGVSTNGLL